MSSEKILDIKNISVEYFSDGKKVSALNSVSMEVHKGETVAVAGESGCGKSSLALAILRLIEMPEGKISGGKIIYKKKDNSVDLLKLNNEEMRDIRGKDISLVLQDPYNSLNPVVRIDRQLKEIYTVHNKKDSYNRNISENYLGMVHLPNPAKILRSFPHQLSGGMLQRVNIAAAILNRPAILIADEPTSSLDVTVQKKIMEMFYELKDEYKLSQIFISHDLNLIAGFADRIYIMYAGYIVESGTAEDIFRRPAHPYTKALLDALPAMGKTLKSIPGEVPSPENRSAGCAFAPRCSKAFKECFRKDPYEKEVGPGHRAACIKL